MARPRLPLLAGLLPVLATVVVWRGALELTLLGWDTYPLIASARVEEAADLARAFTSELMDGRYPLGDYWRPLTHLSFALDHALFGLEARGYHLTGLAILAASAAAVFEVARRWIEAGLGPPAPRWPAVLGGLGGALLWSVHAAHFDVLTVPARRADALAVLFTLWALALAPGLVGRGRGRALAVGLLCAAALASKETGAVAFPLVLAYVFLAAPGGPRARLAAVLPGAWPVWLPPLATLGVRTLVLGGAGGSADSSLVPEPGAVVELLASYSTLALFPPAAFGGAPADTGWAYGRVALALAAVTVALLGLARVVPVRAAGTLDRGAACAFFVLWWLGLTLVTATAGILQTWYALPYVAVMSVTVGWLVGEACRAWSTGRRPARVVGGAVLALALLGVALHGRGAGGGEAARDHRLVSGQTERFLQRFAGDVRACAPGGDLHVQAVFEWVRLDADGAFVRKIFPIGPYSLAAYAELAVPERRVFVVSEGEASPRIPAPDEVRVFVRSIPMVVRP